MLILSFSCKHSFDIFDLSRKITQHFITIFRNNNIIFKTYSSHMLVFINLLLVEILAHLRIIKTLFNFEINKITSRFDSYTHSFFKDFPCTEFTQSCFITSRRTTCVTSNIMNFESEKMS